MRWIGALLLSGLAWACPLTLEVNPQGGVVSPGNLNVTVRAGAVVERLELSLRIEGRWDTYSQAWAWQNTNAGSLSLSVNASLNGQYIFSASSPNCAAVAQARVMVLIPWTVEGTQLPWLLWREAEATNYIEMFGNLRGGQPMFVEGLVTGLAEPLRAVLRDYLVRGYLNRDGNFLPRCTGICYSIAPVQSRLYAVQGQAVSGLFQQGWARLGFYGGQRDSRSYEIGGRGVSGVLVVRGYRHDYILLSAVGDFSDPQVQVVELPKGGAELFRKALSLAALQQSAREVTP
jgi:hypothetical protein